MITFLTLASGCAKVKLVNGQSTLVSAPAPVETVEQTNYQPGPATALISGGSISTGSSMRMQSSIGQISGGAVQTGITMIAVSGIEGTYLEE